MLKYFPIIIFQIYLIITLIIFQFGPISFYVEHPFIFWSFIFSYHISFFVGYLYAIKSTRFTFNNYAFIGNKISINNIRLILLLSIFASLMSMKQFTIQQIFNPSEIYETMLVGLINPGEQYTLKMVNVNLNTSGSKLFNILLFLIVFSKVILIPVIILSWHRLSISLKVIGIIASLLPVISSISNGTNKGVFDLFIYFSSSLLFLFIYNYYTSGKFNLRSRKLFLFVSFIALICAFLFFGHSIGQRGGSVANIELVSPLSQIKLNSYTENYNKYGFPWYVYTWFSYYLVQGYYGFSLSLSENFDTTFGFGNSVFFMRQFEWLTGIDLSTRTFQYKIDSIWDYDVNWHSFYAHIANDFHFVGVAIICLLIGVFLGKIWLSVIYNSNVYGFLLLPIFVLLFIFIPANNQVFGLHETASAAIILFFAWYFSRHKIVI